MPEVTIVIENSGVSTVRLKADTPTEESASYQLYTMVRPALDAIDRALREGTAPEQQNQPPCAHSGHGHA